MNPLVSIGEIELMSTTVFPGASPSATPSFPNSTAATSGVSGSMVTTSSAASATARGLAAGRAPFSSSSAGTGLRACTTSRWPPSRSRPAMGRPMIPRPMKPTSMPQRRRRRARSAPSRFPFHSLPSRAVTAASIPSGGTPR